METDGAFIYGALSPDDMMKDMRHGCKVLVACWKSAVKVIH